MSRRWRAVLLRLHPRSWRDVHGVEFAALLEDTPWTARAVADVVRHAGREQRQAHPRLWATAAVVVLFAVLELASVHAGVTANLFWAPTTPYRAFALGVTVGPLVGLGVWLARRSSHLRGRG
jgi:hypothetical protein